VRQGPGAVHRVECRWLASMGQKPEFSGNGAHINQDRLLVGLLAHWVPALLIAAHAKFRLWNLGDEFFRCSLHYHPERNRVLRGGFIGHVEFLRPLPGHASIRTVPDLKGESDIGLLGLEQAQTKYAETIVINLLEGCHVQNGDVADIRRLTHLRERDWVQQARIAVFNDHPLIVLKQPRAVDAGQRLGQGYNARVRALLLERFGECEGQSLLVLLLSGHRRGGDKGDAEARQLSGFE